MKSLYPVVRRAATTYQLHGRTIPEPYDYLEDPCNAETKEFVRQQNEAFDAYMKSSNEVRDKIVERVTAMLNYARTSNPSLHAGKYYYQYNTGLQNQSVIMQATSLKDDNPTVFLDPNTLSADGTTALKAHAWSENEELFAYSLSDKGSDWQYIQVLNAETGEQLPDKLNWAKFSGISWWKNDGFFYQRYPELSEDVDKGAETDSAQNHYVCFHKVGTAQSEDLLILQVPEHPQWILAAEVTDDHEYLVIRVMNGCDPNNLIWIAKLPTTYEELKRPLEFVKVVNTFVAQYIYVGNEGKMFYMTSTKDASRKKIVSINLETTEEKDVVAEQESVLNRAALVKDTLIVVYLEDVKDVMYYRKLHGAAEMKKLDLPLGTITSLFSDYKKDFVSFKVSSFMLPGRSYVMDINNPQGSLTVYKDDVVNGLNVEDYVTVQHFYQSADGTKIPMFIVHKKGSLSPHSPVMLYGYGGFGISLTPSFSPSRIVFLQNLGGVLAIPNIRGGNEYGQLWHDAGRLTKKQNCFTDFVSAAKYLHSNKIGSPATTAIMGGSNGGLLVAACANQAPDEFSCVVCQVGVLDMFKFHKFTIGHAWISDYGNPDEEEDFRVLEKYSPIHNVRPGVKYPAILVVTGDHDDRVVPLHSLKYVATLQHTNPELGGPFLARVEVAAGHGFGKPTSKIIAETSDMYAFMAKSIGATWHD
ncbi:prolyl oligopeptidase / POP [Leishmania donovani]|uniref:Prolyl endopeptidase n=1 Tax=Leishmania donovani TaxID=5661 RepID=A0A3Q8IJI4_LEIDO|nr:prolyl oligopeptidase, putative [Leishmania donovani]AYU84112.1 serine peptidase clan SC, family S9A, putative [Leishmania donovani]TPP49465.1 Prolyl oligopeptidase, N-terminal beta-propeller domain family protein [Leishmania donovani]TPP53367.1 Prolyl oligopeptidase, N-terminal beta-propeller domain family protein [Leishmania donovani]CAJ1994093.1 prolyl oligopeptidase / POP [Leishmania donovani]CBZ39141.1 prolyl oligopeptidase, putative [Leishmania donovani]